MLVVSQIQLTIQCRKKTLIFEKTSLPVKESKFAMVENRFSSLHHVKNRTTRFTLVKYRHNLKKSNS